MAAHRPAAAEPLAAMRGISKAFPGVLANNRVDFDVYGGEVHALLGENGAGKSTLVKILYGFYRADTGEIRLDGSLIQLRSPHDARRHGIGMVFQTFTLIPALSVVENIALFLPRLSAVLDEAGIARRIEEVARRYRLFVDPWAPVRQLSVGEQQKVEILKLLLAEARILILDEPTRVLAPHEVDGLFEIFANLRRDGYAIVFITHKLPEVLACADRITVMRHGVTAGTLLRAQATEESLVSLMFGQAPPPPSPRRTVGPVPETVPLLELRQVSTRGAAVGLQEITLTVRPGEIVGVAGVSGNGQGELGDIILGLTPCARGTKMVSGRDATNWPVARIRESGVAFIPEEPLAMAMVPGLTVQENMALGDVRKYARRAGFSMDWEAVRHDLSASLHRLSLEDLPARAQTATLSGGNLQRLSLVRELARDPNLIVALYPTRGLDVPSAAAARELLLAARDHGAGVLLISEDLAELFSLSDRLVVLHRGRIAGTFTPQETTIGDVGRLMTGAADPQGHGRHGQ